MSRELALQVVALFLQSREFGHQTSVLLGLFLGLAGEGLQSLFELLAAQALLLQGGLGETRGLLAGLELSAQLKFCASHFLGAGRGGGSSGVEIPHHDVQLAIEVLLAPDGLLDGELRGGELAFEFLSLQREAGQILLEAFVAVLGSGLELVCPGLGNRFELLAPF